MGMFDQMEKAFTGSKKDMGKSLNKADRDFTKTKKQVFSTKKTKKKGR